MRRKILAVLALLLAVLIILAGCGQLKTVPDQGSASTEALPVVTVSLTRAPTEAPAEKAGPVTEPQAIADYIFENGKLPDNFITKDEAKALGWDSSRNYLSDVAPGMSIGGDRFGNYEGQLPKVKGRKFFECDANYRGGKRGGERIVYSNDGHVWYSKDHYETFEELFPSN